MASKQPHCPVCKKPVEREGNDCFPFCSERCQLQDLGKWLNNAYTIPGSSPDGPPQGADPANNFPDSAEEPIE